MIMKVNTMKMIMSKRHTLWKRKMALKSRPIKLKTHRSLKIRPTKLTPNQIKQMTLMAQQEWMTLTSGKQQEWMTSILQECPMQKW